MSRLFFSGLIFVYMSVWAIPAQQDQPTKSALETSPKGFEDLPTNLKNWKRVPIPPKGKLNAKNPWKFDGDTLVCDGVGGHEMLLHEKQMANGIFHVEWRFKKLAGKSGYNSGVYVRNSADGAVWHQAQAGSKAGGYLFGVTLNDGKPAKIPNNKQPGPNRVLEAGEWNTFEVTAKDKTISVWANGYVTSDWPLCDVPKGYIGFVAEGYPIEFKNLKFKRIR